MTFKIKHETKAILIICLITFILAFLTFFVASTVFLIVGFVLTGIMFLSAILYFVEQTVGTKIIIGFDDITIKYVIGYKKFSASDIKNIDIEKYHRYRHGRVTYTEYRMRMKIELYDGKTITLTDKATATTGTVAFLLSKREEMENEDVALYNAYMAIKDLMA